MASHNELGKVGEEMAVFYLKQNGYRILELNYKVRKLEIDIIAMDNDELVIIEVKTRSEDDILSPELAVTKKKQNNLISAANAYIMSRDLDVNTRFDIITITKNKNNQLEHIKSAFYPSIRKSNF
jgi:putative endonuclease